MRLFIGSLIAALSICSISHAGSCVDSKGKDITSSPELFQAEISKKKTCYEAKDLAEACQWGSSLDVSTAGIAADICTKEMNSAKPSKALNALLSEMEKACSDKYSNLQGTMFRSEESYCALDAISFINNLSQEE